MCVMETACHKQSLRQFRYDPLSAENKAVREINGRSARVLRTMIKTRKTLAWAGDVEGNETRLLKACCPTVISTDGVRGKPWSERSLSATTGLSAGMEAARSGPRIQGAFYVPRSDGALKCGVLRLFRSLIPGGTSTFSTSQS